MGAIFWDQCSKPVCGRAQGFRSSLRRYQLLNSHQLKLELMASWFGDSVRVTGRMFPTGPDLKPLTASLVPKRHWARN